jgi:nitrite reductase/ring-hydroxylating ferredoxin subunit
VILPSEGYGGVIAVRATGDQVFAFDMQCTRDANVPEGRTSTDASQLFLNCGKCGSRWQILNGQLIQGPAAFPLLQYQTTFDGFVVNIFN